MTDARDYMADRYAKLAKVALEYEAVSGRHDAAIDDALSAAVEYYCTHVGSARNPRSLFFRFLRRERSRCLRRGTFEGRTGCQVRLCFR
jgi:hypothetical protein